MDSSLETKCLFCPKIELAGISSVAGFTLKNKATNSSQFSDATVRSLTFSICEQLENNKTNNIDNREFFI